jgi:hypothetical protein
MARRVGAICTIPICVSLGTPVQGWLVEVPGSGDDDGKAQSVAFDSEGNVVAGGMLPGSVGARESRHTVVHGIRWPGDTDDRVRFISQKRKRGAS